MLKNVGEEIRYGHRWEDNWTAICSHSIVAVSMACRRLLCRVSEAMNALGWLASCISNLVLWPHLAVRYHVRESLAYLVRQTASNALFSLESGCHPSMIGSSRGPEGSWKLDLKRSSNYNPPIREKERKRKRNSARKETGSWEFLPCVNSTTAQQPRFGEGNSV